MRVVSRNETGLGISKVVSFFYFFGRIVHYKSQEAWDNYLFVRKMIRCDWSSAVVILAASGRMEGLVFFLCDGCVSPCGMVTSSSLFSF